MRPPEFFPSLPVAALLVAADRFVVADTFAYSRQSHQNRTRIRTSAGTGRDAMWLTVPVRKGPPGRSIYSVPLADPRGGWRRAHQRTLAACYNNAPYFAHYAPQLASLFDTVFEAPAPPTLGTLTVATMQWAHQVLASNAEIVVASALSARPSTLPGVWEAAGQGTLLALPDVVEIERALLPGAPVQGLAFDEPPRRQVFEGFVPGCGLLDLVFNYGPAAASMLRAGIRR
ncbi:MAG: WbqC family protein [Bacteroidota bacterium]